MAAAALSDETRRNDGGAGGGMPVTSKSSKSAKYGEDDRGVGATAGMEVIFSKTFRWVDDFTAGGGGLDRFGRIIVGMVNGFTFSAGNNNVGI